MKSKGSATWKGGFRNGRGAISTASGALSDEGYSVGSRFEGDKGTSPEELIAAAHAACFVMALSLGLEQAGLAAESIRAEATVSLDKAGDGFEITSSQLDVVARIPGADDAAFQQIAEKTKQGCPVSRVLKVRVGLQARLEA